MSRRPDFHPTSLPASMKDAALLRELNVRFGRIGQALADFAAPFALTYGTTVNVNALASTKFRLTVTDGVAFTIANPTNRAPGQDYVFDVLNNSGGAMGAVTWGTTYLLAGAWVNPANTKRRTIMFYDDGTNLIETARAAADI